VPVPGFERGLPCHALGRLPVEKINRSGHGITLERR
jgi:hypothetical protein